MLENAVEVVGNFDVLADNVFVLGQGAFGFLTEAKESVPLDACCCSRSGSTTSSLSIFWFWVDRMF